MTVRATRRLPFVLGSAALWLFFVAAHGSWIATPSYDPFGTSRFAWSTVLLVSYLAVSYAVGLPDLPKARPSAVVGALLSTGAAVGVISAAQSVVGAALLPRWSLGGLAITWPIWALLSWNAVRDHDQRTGSRAVFVGHPDVGAELIADLGEGTEFPAEVIATVPIVGPERPDDVAERIASVADELSPDVLILDNLAQADPAVVATAATLHAGGMRVRTPSLFAEEHLGKIPLSDLERTALLFDIGELHRMQYVRTKRLLDVILTLPGFLVLALVVPLVALGNLVGNRGPVFYSQPRVGKGGRVFVIRKFRTMREGRPSTWTGSNDPRITPFGGLLRRSHLDELPQLWNILVGDLSIVGPRPEQPQYVEELCEKIPHFATRNLVRPGLTGWAQVKAPYASSEEDAREKLQYDLYYLRRQSAVLDARIVIRTLRSVVRNEGR